MATNEAKITFRAETADFQSDIKAANNELSDLRAELKLNEAQFQNTGDESTYYQTKLDLLSQELDANKQKQEALTSEIEVAKEIFGENSEEVSKLETSLTYAQVQEENLKKQVTDTTDAMEGQTDATDDAGSSLDDLAEVVAAAGIADAVKEIAEAAYEVASAFDDASAAIVEGTGASGEALEELEDAANSAFGEIADADTTIEDVSGTLAELNTRFGVTGDEAEELTVSITNFANHCGTDATTAVDELADVTQRWGLDVDDVDGLLDDLTTANQACSLSVDDMTGYLSKNSVQFQELGYSTEDALALLISLSDGGANVSTVMSGMTKAVSNLSEVTDDVPGSFQDAIDAIADCDTVSEALQAQVGDTGLTVEDVFGTKAAQELATNVQNGNFAIEEWTAVLEENEGTLDDTTESATTMDDSWQQAMNNISLVMDSVFSPVVSTVVEGLAGIVTNIAQIVQDSPALQAVIAAVSAALVVLAAALAISSLISAVQKAFALLNTTMLACPLTWIVLAIAALVAAFITAYNNCDAFREVVDTAFAKIQEIISTVVETVKTILETLREKIQTLKEKFEDFKEKVSEAFETIQEVISTVVGTITGIFGTFKTAIGNVGSKFQSMKSTVGTAVSGMASTISGKFSSAKSTVTSKVGSIYSTISGKFSSAKSSVSSAMSNIYSKISTKLTSAKSTVSTKMGDIASKFGEKMETAKTKVSNAIEKIKGFFDFSWSLPSLKMPHFSVSGEFSLNPLSVPTFKISWYKEGGILDGATIFGELGGTLLGGGEAGPEAVAPIDVLQGYIADAVNGEIADGLNAVAAAVEAMAARPVYVTVDGKTIASATADYMDAELGRISRIKAR